jgi:hypothetical protein
LIILWALLSVTQSFYFSTLEEYYIGGLFLGPFNGVTDGSALLISIFLFTGIFGNDIWLQTVTLPRYGEASLSEIIVYTILITQLIAVALNLYSAFKNAMRTDLTEEQRSHGEPMNYIALIQQTAAYYMLFYVIYVAAKINDGAIM